MYLSVKRQLLCLYSKSTGKGWKSPLLFENDSRKEKDCYDQKKVNCKTIGNDQGVRSFWMKDSREFVRIMKKERYAP